MKKAKYPIILLFIFIVKCSGITKSQFTGLFSKWLLNEPELSECIDKSDKSIFEKYIDKASVTETYLEFSEPCNGAFCQFAKLSFGDDQFIMVNTPYHQNTNQMFGLTIYRVSDDELLELKENMFMMAPNEIQDDVNASQNPDLVEVNQYYNGEIPYCFKLPKKGNEMVLVVHPEMATDEQQDIIFGAFKYIDGKFDFYVN